MGARTVEAGRELGASVPSLRICLLSSSWLGSPPCWHRPWVAAPQVAAQWSSCSGPYAASPANPIEEKASCPPVPAHVPGLTLVALACDMCSSLSHSRGQS